MTRIEKYLKLFIIFNDDEYEQNMKKIEKVIYKANNNKSHKKYKFKNLSIKKENEFEFLKEIKEKEEVIGEEEEEEEEEDDDELDDVDIDLNIPVNKNISNSKKPVNIFSKNNNQNVGLLNKLKIKNDKEGKK